MARLNEVDPEIARAIENEIERESQTINLVASENFVSDAILKAQGSVMTNKYAEGYPERRYYGGCEFVDVAENLAIQRAKELFGAEHVNVQPHSGSQANMAVYFAVLNIGDTIMGMSLSHGGHLTHGSPASFSGKYFRVIPYGVDKKTETLNFDELAGLARRYRPKLIVAGASAYPRILDFKAFREVADQVGAYLMADIAHIAGLIAVDLHPSPIPYAEFVTTTTHKTLRGPRAGMVMCKKKFARLIDEMVFPGIQGGPLMHAIAAKAVAFKEAMAPAFKEYQRRILTNAKAFAEALIREGFRLVSGGTDTHLILVDLRNKNITGQDAEEALDRAGIAVNRNAIPFETQGPFVTSGLRLGTPTVTTRGMSETEMAIIAGLIKEVLENARDEAVLEKVRGKARKLCEQFPLRQEAAEVREVS